MIDGLGVGELPDAFLYGDTGSSTLLHVAERTHLRVPHLNRLGLGSVQPARGLEPAAVGCYGRMAEESVGKDSMTGHWEMMGVVTSEPFETFPQGFPRELLERFADSIGVPVIGNVVASGTEVLDQFGGYSLETGCPIVYTSVDSVFQLAAHTDNTPPDALYGWCEFARLLLGPGVARVIARPFTGVEGAFTRLERYRRDYPVPFPPDSALWHFAQNRIPTIGIGKVRDLFPGHVFDDTVGPDRDEEMIFRAADNLRRLDHGLIFVNAGDIDSKYGHRNDPDGWAVALSHLDDRLETILGAMSDDDVLIVTADHGNDPTTGSTDHSREYVPLLVCSGAAWRTGGHGIDIGTRTSFCDVGITVAELLAGNAFDLPGTSFADAIQ